jgi:hypothetical protein
MKKISILQLLFIILFLSFSKISTALPNGWANAMPIQIQNNMAVSVTNYQVQLTINTQALIALGQMNPNGSDIRFGKDCSGNILFNYWIESGINTPNTIIWVKMDSLNSLETRTIYMFYNNSGAAAVSAVNGTFFGPNSSTDSVASGAAGGVGSCQRGFRFSANESILITDFGKRVPNATTRYVTLFNYLTQAVIAQIQVAGPAAQYTYSSLPNPIWLVQGTQYVLEVYQGPADNSYYFGTSSQIGQHLTYLDMRYCNACTQNTFPTSVLTNYHYGYPDFWYYTKTNLATPPTVTLGAGGGGVSFTATPSSICLGGSSTLSGIGGATYNWQPGNFNGNPYVVTPAATTTYTVTATTANGCTVTSTLTVTINPMNTGTGSASPDPICLGSSTTINASAITSCPGNVNNFAGIYAPANWTFSVNNSNGTVNTGGAPANIIISSGMNNSGLPGSTNYSKAISCSGTVTFDWSYFCVDLFGSIFDYPRYTINGGAPINFSSFVIGGSNSQTGIQTIPVNPGDIIELQMYTIDNGSPQAFLTITNFAAPDNAVTGTVSIWDAPSGGNNLGAPPQIVTPAVGGVVNYYVEITSNGPGSCVNPVRVAVPVTVNSFASLTPSASPSAICLGSSSVLSSNAATNLWNPGALVGSPTVSPIATTTYSLTGTDANGCTATATIEVVVNGLPTVSASASPATICEGLSSMLMGSGAATYFWNPGALVGMPSVTPLVTTTYTVTGTDGNGCTGTTDVTVTVNPAPIVTATATPATTCNLTVVTPVATGAPTINWTGGVTNNVPFVATTTTTYTVTGTDGLGCDGTTTVLVTVNPASGNLAPTTTNQSQDQGDDFNVNYYDASCDLIATVDDGAGGNILGLTTSTVNVDATAGFHNGQPFVRRWYQITPTSNGAADVILYINQSDFNDYNAAVLAPYLPLPTSGNNADPNIANIRITKNTDAGLGNSPIVITPTVNWNGTYWELSFNTPSFSQFRVHSVNPGNVPLPATVTNFSGMKLETSDKLSWTTSSEQNNAYFNLQHSTDGTNFTTIAKVNSKAPNGNSAATLNYTSINPEPKLGHNYYRLQQVDLDNKTSVHAQIVDLIWGANGNTVSIYPNPTTDILNIDLYAQTAQNTTVKLLDMSGRVIKQIQAKSAAGMNYIKLKMSELANGVYTVQVYENNNLTYTSKVKKGN